MSEYLELLERVESLPKDSKIKGHPRISEGRNLANRFINSIIAESREPLIVLVDGLPGSGKSGLAEGLTQNVGQRALIGLDDFIGTERGTIARGQLTDSEDNFRAGYMRYEYAQSVLNQATALMQEGKESSFNIERAYRRDLGGKFGTNELTIPANTQAIVVEGTGVIDNIHLSEGVSGISVYVYARIKQALLNSTLRDIRNRGGDADFNAIYTQRLREYQYLLKGRAETIEKADIVCKRYPDKRAFRAKLDNEAYSNAQVLSQLPSEVLTAISPKGVDLNEWLSERR